MKLIIIKTTYQQILKTVKSYNTNSVRTGQVRKVYDTDVLQTFIT